MKRGVNQRAERRKGERKGDKIEEWKTKRKGRMGRDKRRREQEIRQGGKKEDNVNIEKRAEMIKETR